MASRSNRPSNARRKSLTEENLAFIHPYEDAKIVAGQGTVALELLDAAPDLDAIVAPIGGGGLISGIALGAKALKPDIEIYGAEAEALSVDV